MSAITANRLRKLVHYDPDTGVFHRLIATSHAKVGDVAGSLNEGGYLRFRVDGHEYLAHRLAWLYMTGKWPKDEIDHKNGICKDNRWTNLRQSSRALNVQNLHYAQRNNKTGLLGVSPIQDGGFQARIVVNKTLHYLGYFRTAEEAHAVYIEAKRLLHVGCTI